MSNIDIIRAWKDEEYRNSLSEEERSQLPENPAGMIELSDDAAQAVAGGKFVANLPAVFGFKTDEYPACGYATKQVFCLRI
ncbi:MAG: mersacidin/lichenicidin family type 2 lantibiotic [Coleofasciculus sp. G1-WW12-02]|uniref:mersacidin/lichenicidin family type 2 lantibiotic n=1 Tax=Coleofasciculus sp. G1-WW12-02 TaxID=3068483 RepID=UPI0032F782D3